MIVNSDIGILTSYSDIFSHIVACLEPFVNLSYSESWHIQNPRYTQNSVKGNSVIFRTLCNARILRTLPYLELPIFSIFRLIQGYSVIVIVITLTFFFHFNLKNFSTKLRKTCLDDLVQKTTRVITRDNTTRVQHEYTTTQHEYTGSFGSRNRALLCTFCIPNSFLPSQSEPPHIYCLYLFRAIYRSSSLDAFTKKGILLQVRSILAEEYPCGTLAWMFSC